VTRRLLLILTSACSLLLHADDPENYKRPFPPFRVAGNLYYVGTEDLACYLITSSEGHILINTGLADSVPLLKTSIEKLGFQLSDVKILLTMQAHYDHVAAMAEVQKATGAKMYATPGDTPPLVSGGKIDGIGNSPASQFTPVRVDRTLKDGETIKLGDSRVTVLFHPGHTKGSASYQLTAGGKAVLLVNLPSVVQPLVGNQTYPKIVDDYERTFAAQKKLRPGIWLAAHASQFDMQAKVKAGSFNDPGGYLAAIAEAEKAYREKLAKQQTAPGRRSVN